MILRTALAFARTRLIHGHMEDTSSCRLSLRSIVQVYCYTASTAHFVFWQCTSVFACVGISRSPVPLAVRVYCRQLFCLSYLSLILGTSSRAVHSLDSHLGRRWSTFHIVAENLYRSTRSWSASVRHLIVSKQPGWVHHKHQHAAH